MSVTLVPVERVHESKNGHETYVEACLKIFRKQWNIINREIIAFITILHLIIYPKQFLRSSWSKASNALPDKSLITAGL